MRKVFGVLGLIILLAGLLRFYSLSTNPPGLNLDEVAIGFNARSILETGRDEYGYQFPLAFRSHDDYKPPLYIYLTVPSVAVFGENEFGVRFPSALLGTLAVITTFFLVRELFPGKNRLALLSAFLLAISPWQLQFSRAAFETGSTAFFTTLGTYLFLKGVKSQKTLPFTLSALIFGLELYLYQAAKIFVPLFIFSLFLVYVRKINTKIILFGLVFLIFFAPVAYFSTTPEGQIRFKGTSVYQNPVPKQENDLRQTADWLDNNRFAASLLHPPEVSYKTEMISGYLSHFNPEFLFIGKNGPPVNYIPDVGLLYLWELPFLIIGLFFLWKRADKKPAIVLTIWMLLAPIPAALTAQVPSSIRTAIILPTFQIIIALGIIELVKKSKILLALFLLIPAVSCLYMLHMLFVHAPKEFSQAWFYSYKQIVEETAKFSKDYDEVIVSTSLRQPQNFYAFYLGYDPKKYIFVDGGTISGGFNENRNHFDKYQFRPFNYTEEAKSSKRILFVGKPEEFPVEVVPLATFKYLDGQTSDIIVGKR